MFCLCRCGSSQAIWHFLHDLRLLLTMLSRSLQSAAGGEAVLLSLSERHRSPGYGPVPGLSSVKFMVFCVFIINLVSLGLFPCCSCVLLWKKWKLSSDLRTEWKPQAKQCQRVSNCRMNSSLWKQLSELEDCYCSNNANKLAVKTGEGHVEG